MRLQDAARMGSAVLDELPCFGKMKPTENDC